MKKTNLIKAGLLIALGGALVACGGTASSETSTGSSASEFDTSKTIKTYTRDRTSGTRDGFFTGIGLEDAKTDNTPLVDGVVEVSSNGDMMTKVANDEYGIGYISLSTLSENDQIKGLKYDGVVPNEENVLSGDYELTRNFNYIKRATPRDEIRGELVDAYIAFMGTTEGKAIIEQEGGIVEYKSDDPTWESISSEYPVVSDSTVNVTISYGGSTSVKNTAIALAKAFQKLCAGTVSFSENFQGSGDAYKFTQGTEKDSTSAMDIAFASRDFKADSEPAAANTTGTLAIDAIVAIVNAKNPYAETTAKTLHDIYTGTITSWSEVLD